MNPNFINPYANVRKTLEPADILRLSIDVPKQEVRAIRAVLMDYGALNVAETLLVKHLYEYVREHKLSIGDHDKLVNYITELLVDSTGNNPKAPNAGSTSASKTRGGNERRGTGQVHSGGKK